MRFPVLGVDACLDPLIGRDDSPKTRTRTTSKIAAGVARSAMAERLARRGTISHRPGGRRALPGETTCYLEFPCLSYLLPVVDSE
jgi:hypothetical protein